MAKRGIMITGVSALSQKLKQNATMDDVKKVVKTNTVELNRDMKKKAQFKGHYKNGAFITPTGATRRSITSILSLNGLQSKTMPTTEYSFYLEYGTRFMSAQPFVYPAFLIQRKQFLDDMQKLVK